MLKKEIITKLSELGIAYDSKSTAKQLEALLPAGESAPEEAVVEKRTNEAAVYAKGGGHIRTYTREAHGAGFNDLAKEFAAHNPGAEIRIK